MQQQLQYSALASSGTHTLMLHAHSYVIVARHTVCNLHTMNYVQQHPAKRDKHIDTETQEVF